MRHALYLVILGWFLTGCASNATERSDLQHLFRDAGFDGATVIYDLRTNHYTTVHGERADRMLLPASTFKIPNSLIALETGVVKNEHTVFTWDGQERERPALNRDHDLASAIENSVVWYYQIIARRDGVERMQRFLDAFDYGNRKISPKIDTFWLDGDLRISARQQVDFISKLVREELSVSQRSMRIEKKF